MSSFGGLQKVQSYYNRMQQKRDWQLILSKIRKEQPAPDWTKSVKKIDAYMEKVCNENGINFKEICGVG